jgi:arsenate reductase-like glutaredoxin family protein
MEFKNIVDYVEDNKKDYIEKELVENKQKLEAKNYFNSMTRDELKQVLSDAGFEVVDGVGKVIFTGDENVLNQNQVEQLINAKQTTITESNVVNDLKLSNAERIEQARRILDSRK